MARHRKRRFQFTIGTLLLLLFALSVIFAYSPRLADFDDFYALLLLVVTILLLVVVFVFVFFILSSAVWLIVKFDRWFRRATNEAPRDS